MKLNKLNCCIVLTFVLSKRSMIPITVRHGSADTVVRAMNAFNGKCYFSGSDSSETFWRIFKKILHSWLRRRPHPTRKCWGQSVQRGRVCACVKLSPSGVYFFFFLFLGLMRIATGRSVGPINAINGSNDASCWHSYSLYGLDNKN